MKMREAEMWLLNIVPEDRFISMTYDRNRHAISGIKHVHNRNRKPRPFETEQSIYVSGPSGSSGRTYDGPNWKVIVDKIYADFHPEAPSDDGYPDEEVHDGK